MSVAKINLPKPVKTTENAIDFDSNYSGGKIAVYNKKSKVLSDTESSAWIMGIHKKYKDGQKARNLPEIGWNYHRETPDATHPQVIKGADGNYYVSLQSAPEVAKSKDPVTGKIQMEKRPVQTVIYKMGANGEIYSKKAYLNADLDAAAQGKVGDPAKTKGYLTFYGEVDKKGQVISRIQSKPVQTMDPKATQLDLRHYIDENLVDTRQLPKDGSILHIGQ